MPANEQPVNPLNPARPSDAAGASTGSRPAIWAITPPAADRAPAEPAVEPATAAAAPAPPKPSPWPARWSALGHGLSQTGRWIARAWNTPKVRPTLIGAFSLLLGAVIVPGSAWTLPLIILGVVLLLIASVGSRLQGRLAVEWGQHGAQLEVRAEIKSTPSQAGSGLRLAPVPEDPDVIEGEAHTVEIDVDELKTLIAAAEAAEQTRAS